jgi:hypothetical protein
MSAPNDASARPLVLSDTHGQTGHLFKVMARTGRSDLTSWLGDLPTHNGSY